jgi:hypothetical protein
MLSTIKDVDLTLALCRKLKPKMLPTKMGFMLLMELKNVILKAG